MTDNPTHDTAIFEKLGFRPGETVFVESTPAWYGEQAESVGIELIPDITATHAHLFFTSRRELDQFLKDYDIHDIEQSLWISWPRQSARTQSSLTEQDLRDAVLPLGWVDTKVVAIDDTWSGLKFVRRKA